MTIENGILTIKELQQKWLDKQLNDGLYTGINSDGEDVTAVVDDLGFNIRTYQNNGWVRIDYFNYNSRENYWDRGESYAGTWK